MDESFVDESFVDESFMDSPHAEAHIHFLLLIAEELGDLSLASEVKSSDSNAFHVQYDHETDQYIPVCSPCREQIPTMPTPKALEWARRRLELKDVQTKPDARGFMRGKVCKPEPVDSCPNCHASSTMFLDVEKPELIVRTYRGAIARRVVDVKCRQCQHVRSWNPYSECILTINHGREGGS
jgi:hypothetical protein